MSPAVTIYIPTKNRRPLLERAVRSVVEQTFSDIEIIVVNDCSTDDTREYLEGLALKDSRIVPIHLDVSSGAPVARNTAIRAATGRYVTGLDDDDEFRSDRIELFLSHWQSLGGRTNDISCLFSDFVIDDGSAGVNTALSKDVVTSTDLFWHNYIGNQVFCPKDRWLSIGGFDPAMPAWQDLDLLIRLLNSYGSAIRVPQATYIYHLERNLQRISMNAKARFGAYDTIIRKNAGIASEPKQALFLQLFGSFYGTAPGLSDWKRMLSLGLRPMLLWRLARATVKNRLRTHRSAGPLDSRN